MSTGHRICETCVYCSFAGNCDRYDKPLTSIEQPACDAYEIHPLLAENAKLRQQLADVTESMGRVEERCAKLRELCKEWYRFARGLFDEFIGEPEADEDFMTLEDRLRKVGVEPY